jgi:hypothetical protein
VRVGVNAHVANEGVTPSLVRDLGAKIVRFPVWLDAVPLGTYQDFATECQHFGAEPLIVLDDRAHGARGNNETYAGLYRRFQTYFPTVHRWQILNEPDGLPNTPSGPQKPSVVTSRLRSARVGLGPRATIYAPGMAGNGSPGGAAYLDQVSLAAANVVCVHLYGSPPGPRRPPYTGIATIPEIIASYRHFGKPIYVTEIGCEAGLFSEDPTEAEHMRAVYYTEALTVLDQLGVGEVDPYCLTDTQGGVYGLWQVGVGPVESWAAVHGATL